MSWKEKIKKGQQIDIKDYTEMLEKLRQLAQKHNPNAMAHVDKLQEELLHLNTERQYGRMVQKKEVKKNYVGYGRDMAEILKDEEEEIKDLKKDIRYILERIEELHEGRNYIKKELQSKSLDDMLPAEDIKSAIKAIDSVLRDLRLN